MLEPSGMTYEEFKDRRVLQARKEYKKNDYRTPSGKVEIYSERLQKMGHSPMPLWEELSPQPEINANYPLLFTNAKEEAYMLSGYKHVAALRKIRPEPLVELHPNTAQRLGLEEGDWVYIETKEGKIKQRLSLNSDLDERVVFGAFGWWFPEEADTLYGWDRANINILTPSGPDLDPLTGSTQLRGIPCRVCSTEN